MSPQRPRTSMGFVREGASPGGWRPTGSSASRPGSSAAGRGRAFDSWAAEEEEEPGLSEAVRALNQRLNLAMTYDSRAARHAKPKKHVATPSSDICFLGFAWTRLVHPSVLTGHVSSLSARALSVAAWRRGVARGPLAGCSAPRRRPHASSAAPNADCSTLSALSRAADRLSRGGRGAGGAQAQGTSTGCPGDRCTRVLERSRRDERAAARARAVPRAEDAPPRLRAPLRGHAPPPPPSRTKWTRLVHPSVLIGHVPPLRAPGALRRRRGAQATGKRPARRSRRAGGAQASLSVRARVDRRVDDVRCSDACRPTPPPLPPVQSGHVSSIPPY